MDILFSILKTSKVLMMIINEEKLKSYWWFVGNCWKLKECLDSRITL